MIIIHMEKVLRWELQIIFDGEELSKVCLCFNVCCKVKTLLVYDAARRHFTQRAQESKDRKGIFVVYAAPPRTLRENIISQKMHIKKAV